MDCFIRTFDPLADPTYKLTKSDRLIMLRSGLTHSEFQFSARYRGVSASATMADKCRCVRFKMIDYSKHPERWKTQVVHLSDAQEDAIIEEARILADFNYLLGGERFSAWGAIYYGPAARKYDLAGVVVCNILPCRLIRSNGKWYWCSEFVCHLIQVAYPDFNGHPDTQTPETLYNEWEAYSNAA